MSQVLIRNLPQDVVDRLKAKATAKGVSLEQELRSIVVAAAPVSPQERAEMLAKVRAMQKRPLKHDSTKLIRDDRNR